MISARVLYVFPCTCVLARLGWVDTLYMHNVLHEHQQTCDRLHNLPLLASLHFCARPPGLGKPLVASSRHSSGRVVIL